MKEIGGYIELESFHGSLYHEDAIRLNCGRNALAYIIKAKNIKKIYLPYFLCSSVSSVCKSSGVEIAYYSVDKDFHPILDFDLQENEYLYIVNYYGQLENSYIEYLHDTYRNVIVDNAQSYFQLPVEGVDTLYTCRKYFGVADGAFLYTDKKLECSLSKDESFERMHFLLGRYERTANEFYSEYVSNNKLFASEPIKEMSSITENLLRGINYDFVAKKREQNFSYLHEQLKRKNRLELKIPYGAFMYPLWIENGRDIRKELQKEKIYIPTLWPDVFSVCQEDSLEYQMAADILPLPVDQRYGIREMQYLVEEIEKCIG